MNFSSLWCIKDRDPKQVERKVLSFQRHYSIPPPGVKARFTIFWFLLSFRYFGWKCEVYVWIVYAVILYIYSFLYWCVGSVLRSPLRPSAKRLDTAKRLRGEQKKRPFPGALDICIFFVKKNNGGRRKKRTAPIAEKQRGRLYCFGWGWRMDTPQPCGSAWPAAGSALSGAALRGGSCSSGINSLLMTVSISSSLFTSSGEKRSRTRSMTVCR